jgi:hypothetical protein
MRASFVLIPTKPDVFTCTRKYGCVSDGFDSQSYRLIKLWCQAVRAVPACADVCCTEFDTNTLAKNTAITALCACEFTNHEGAAGLRQPTPAPPHTMQTGLIYDSSYAPASTGGSGTQTLPLKSGHRGTAQTVAWMRSIIDKGIKDQNINRLAIQIVWNTPEFSETPKAQAIFNWMQQNLRFIPDMVGKETLRTPEETLAVRAGDCDCFTILAATLLGTIGIESRARTISTNPDDPNTYSHIYPEAFCDGQWIAMDRGRPNSAFGLEPQHYFISKTWPLFENSGVGDTNVSGLSGYMGCPGVRGMGRGQLGRMRGVPIHLAGARPHRKFLGQGDENIAAVIAAAGSSAANIINASSGNLPAGYAYNSAGALVPTGTVLPSGQIPAGYTYNSLGQLVYTGSSSIGGISSGTLMLFLLLGAAFVVLR